ncbi:MAG: 1-acyl-sn-glycerol-3-phosphate acyltransferase [Butyrivibrio sp.]|nr:1-acyl-sn-glycerol-3-phosphate acyltransferase [Butyrivibrio sp.]
MKKHFVYRLVRKIVDFVMPVYQIEGAENIPDGPVVIVGNHSQAFGPLTAELYFPRKHYTWCISEMMEKDKVADYAYKDFWSKKPVLLRPFFRLFSYMIPRLAEIIFTNADTLPVYRDKRVMKTFQLSCDRLKEGAAIVIFPEDYIDYNNIVHEFQRGFVHVAKYYYRQNGQAIPFVPMYVCPGLRKLVFGKPIMYCPENPSSEEADRICTYLQESISEIAYALPRHRVVPYPNVSRKYYPYNERL